MLEDVQKSAKRQQRFSARLGVYVVLCQGDLLLLLRRAKTGFFDGYLSVPSGSVEQGESLPQAACREMSEEIGANIRPTDLRLFHVIHRYKNAIDQRIDFFFACDRWQSELRNCEPEKHDMLLWVSRNELPSNVVPYHREALACLDRGILLSLSDWPRPSE